MTDKLQSIEAITIQKGDELFHLRGTDKKPERIKVDRILGPLGIEATYFSDSCRVTLTHKDQPDLYFTYCQPYDLYKGQMTQDMRLACSKNKMQLKKLRGDITGGHMSVFYDMSHKLKCYWEVKKEKGEVCKLRLKVLCLSDSTHSFWYSTRYKGMIDCDLLASEISDLFKRKL